MTSDTAFETTTRKANLGCFGGIFAILVVEPGNIEPITGCVDSTTLEFRLHSLEGLSNWTKSCSPGIISNAVLSCFESLMNKILNFSPQSKGTDGSSELKNQNEHQQTRILDNWKENVTRYDQILWRNYDQKASTVVTAWNNTSEDANQKDEDPSGDQKWRSSSQWSIACFKFENIRVLNSTKNSSSSDQRNQTTELKWNFWNFRKKKTKKKERRNKLRWKRCWKYWWGVSKSLVHTSSLLFRVCFVCRIKKKLAKPKSKQKKHVNEFGEPVEHLFFCYKCMIWIVIVNYKTKCIGMLKPHLVFSTSANNNNWVVRNYDELRHVLFALFTCTCCVRVFVIGGGKKKEIKL